MKKSKKKVINYLKQYIGHEMLRTKPARGDWSYTDHNPLIFVGFTSEGCIIYRHTGHEAYTFENREYILPEFFTDRNWITYRKALRAKGNILNKWKCKRIKSICPVGSCKDKSFMGTEPPTLISASKHHMFILFNDASLKGKKSVLRSDYMNPEYWVLAE
ncbi:MAG: hypothetical protein K6D97_07700 [Clostridia bacterium]|nr:hypothetical protein [Clostridia bacterium]